MEAEAWDSIVIGGGAAGLSAALMLGRARRRVLVIDAGRPRNRFAAHMHGVLSNEGTDPSDLLERGRAEAAGYGVEFEAGTVDRVEETGTGVRVAVAGGGDRTARTVIVATGLTDELPAVPGLAERWGRSVLHCPYCHGWEVRDQHLGVLTTSPLSLHQAELVRQWSDRVTVFTAGLGPLDPSATRRLRARGIELVAAPVTEVLGEGEQISAVRVEDGREIALDALFTAGTPRPHDGFLAHLGLARVDGPMGSFLEVDPMGRTSSPRIWAAGNVVDPAANVPMAIGTGSFVGAAVNAALVAEEFDAASPEASAWPETPPVDYWEGRYAESAGMWSGAPNQTLADVVAGFVPGRALDLGCGEGADAIWLAQHGWTVTGVDISPTAIDRAGRAAEATGLSAERIRFVAADLATWTCAETYDLVAASFLHSPVALSRTEILRRAAGCVAPGGRLLVVSHGAPPPWAQPSHGHEHQFLSPTEEIDALALDPVEWTTRIAETRARQVTRPGGEQATVEDTVVLLQRS